MTDGRGEEDEGGSQTGALATERLRWHLEVELNRLAGRETNDVMPTPLEGSASFVAWWAFGMPLLFTRRLESLLADVVEHMEDAPEVPESVLQALPWLYAGCAALGLGVEPIARLAEGITHHNSTIRSAVNRSLALISGELSFEDGALRLAVEECIRRQYTDSEDAALVLLAAPGDVDDKRRWAAAQLVRHVGHGRGLRSLLEAASEGRPLPNSLIAPMARSALQALAPLMTVGGTKLEPDPGEPEDWPKTDAIRLGRELWPPVVLHRILELPFLHGSIEPG